MKNLFKLITLAVIAIFIAVSCAPPLEETGYDWKDANATRDATKNSGYNLSLYVPSASIVGTPKTGTGAASNTIIEIDVDITFPDRADVLRSEITQAALSFITFHTYTKATAALTADELSAAIPFTFENRTGNKVSVKLTTSINTAAAYSDLLLRVDGKKYTYDHGLRLDIDTNGKIEDIYDDQYIRTLTITGTGGGTKADPYAGPGQQNTFYLLLPANINSRISTVSAATAAPTNPNVFYFIGTAQTTNANTLIIDYLGTVYATTTDAEKAYFKDRSDTMAKGIKLQKLNGTTWTDVKTAEYDPTPRNNTTYAEAATGNVYIVIKDVSFEHLATYRIIWSGSAYTETSGTYYGVKQRIYVSSGASGTARFNVTEVATTAVTPYNTSLASFIPASDFASKATTTAYSYDSEAKNVVLKVDLTKSGLYWKTVALADFKKSFQIVYSNATDGNGDPIAPGNTNPALVYIDVKNIEFKAEGSAIVGGTEKGKNVLYITLDTNFVFDVDAGSAYKDWLDTTYADWKDAKDAYDDWVDACEDYTENLKPQWDVANAAYQQYLADYADYETDKATWDAAEADSPGSGGPEPQPPLTVLDPGQEPTNPASSPVSPPDPNDNVGPVYPASKGTDLYFRINDGISVSDNAANNPTVFIFGNPGNFAYDYFEFYEVF